MDRNKLAALANDSGGITEASDILGIERNIYDRAILGQDLSRLDKAEIDLAYAHFEQKEDESYLQFIDNTAELINDSVSLQGYERNFTGGFMLAVAEGQISEAQINDLYTLWGNLNNYQANVIMEKFLEDKNFNADTLTELYLEEEDLFKDYQHSEFWAYFRETFYND